MGESVRGWIRRRTDRNGQISVSRLPWTGLALAVVIVLSIHVPSASAAPPTDSKSLPASKALPTASASNAKPPVHHVAAAPLHNAMPAHAVPPAVKPSAPVAASLSPAALAGRHAVIAYLGQALGWYRGIETEESLASQPDEILFITDDRRMVGEAINLAFDYAHADASILKAAHRNPNAEGAPSSVPEANASDGNVVPKPRGPAFIPGLLLLNRRLGLAEAKVEQSQAKITSLQARIAHASPAMRDKLASQLVSAQGELSLAQSRIDSIKAMIEFESGTSINGSASRGLDAQIDELARSVQVKAGHKGRLDLAVSSPPPAPSGIMGRIEGLSALDRKSDALSARIAATNALLQAAEQLRAPLGHRLRAINLEAARLAAQLPSGDVATLRATRIRFEQLTASHKLYINAILPLIKQMVILHLYTANLERWHKAVRRQFNVELRSLIIRVVGLAVLLALIFGGALAWRILTFRYIHDIQRRNQLLQMRRLAVVVVVSMVLLFYFANELGALATVMGFAAAGIALTLQNVITSLAGYFYVGGRYGIKVGDRVQLSGTTGDVLEVGLFKMTMMEVDSDPSGSQATGRIVVFPNSIVFQPNGNFFKQAPGTNLTWNELRLTLAPDCDYRIAEKRIVEVVNQVFAHYRDMVQRDYHNMERALNVRVDVPRPQSRLLLGEAGIELVVRYPAQIQTAAQTSDEVTRRLVDAIKREPGLKLVAQVTPVLQPDTSEGFAPEKEKHDAQSSAHFSESAPVDPIITSYPAVAWTKPVQADGSAAANATEPPKMSAIKPSEIAAPPTRK